MDPIKNMERVIEMLSISCDLVTEEESSLLRQIIKQIDQVLNKTTPESIPEPTYEPTPEPTPEPACIVTPTTEINNNLITILKAIDSLGVRMGQMESSLAATSFTGSMASQSGVTSNGTNGRGFLNSWAATASFRGSTSSGSTTTPNEQTNNGFITVQYLSRNQPKATSRNFTDQRLILIGSRNNDW
jgi:hypothetical protein